VSTLSPYSNSVREISVAHAIHAILSTLSPPTECLQKNIIPKIPFPLRAHTLSPPTVSWGHFHLKYILVSGVVGLETAHRGSLVVNPVSQALVAHTHTLMNFQLILHINMALPVPINAFL